MVSFIIANVKYYHNEYLGKLLMFWPKIIKTFQMVNQVGMWAEN